MRGRNKYFVVLHEGEWTFKNGDQHSHPYPTQREAIDAAIEAAHTSERDGQPSQVLVQGEDLLFRTAWTYGKDPYPPAWVNNVSLSTSGVDGSRL